MKVTTNWVSHLAFDVTADTGQTVRLDTTLENGSLGSGMNPKKMMLASLCGCSGIDVVEILNKMKVPFSKLTIEATAEQTDTVPKVFSVIHMTYKADVGEAHLDQFTRAVSLSQEKYCGVSAMLAKTCPIHFKIELV
ncbi:MAG: OsmC family protein [Sediminibacterium sp.]|jgi:putative redox protein|nr:OsmC family protein [Sediminibacterium sp.]